MAKRYWLMKCEPGAYSIDDLKRDGRTSWEGVRNYQARNFLRDEIQVGDAVLYYHSNADPSGVAGLARIVKAGYPDHHSWDPRHKYFDPKTDPEKPTWYMVDLQYVKKCPDYVSLADLKAAEGLDDMMVLKKGSRLSVQPLEKQHYERIKKMGGC